MNSIGRDKTGWAYGMKSLNNKCEVSIKYKGNKIKTKNCIALVDYGRGLFNYKTKWKWSTGTGRTKENLIISFNYGDDPGIKNSVDFVKIQGKTTGLLPVKVEYNRKDLMKEFKFKTHENFKDIPEGQAEFTFTPNYLHKMSSNKIILSYDMKYIYGTLDGFVVDAEGKTHEFIGMKGLFEIINVKW